MKMLFKRLFKLTKIRIFWVIVLFVGIGMWKIFTLESMMTGEEYKNSLFQQYQFQYQHWNDAWHTKEFKWNWTGYLLLHIFFSYITVGIFSFILNRLRGKE
jgi:hypothetical protein